MTKSWMKVVVIPALLVFAARGWSEQPRTTVGLLQNGSVQMTAAISDLGKGNLEGASVSSAKAFDLVLQAPAGGSNAAVVAAGSSGAPRLMLSEIKGEAPKAPVPTPPGKAQGIGREVGQFVGAVMGSLMGWFMGGNVGSQIGQAVAKAIALPIAQGMLDKGGLNSFLDAIGTLYGALGAAAVIGQIVGTTSGYIAGTVIGSVVGARIGKWFDKKK